MKNLQNGYWYSRGTPMFLIRINKEACKKVFILEDWEDRIKWFKRVFSFATLNITRLPNIAIETLSKEKFDLIFLDHDLTESAYGNEEEPKELTGLIVAEQLRDTLNKETDCIIHSMNPVGASNMLKAHPFNTVHVPFHMLQDSVEFL